MAVVRMIEGEKNLDALAAELRHLRRGETKMDELHRRGLVVVAARVLAVALRDAANRLAADDQYHVILDAAESFERGLAARLLVDLEHYRGDQLAALRDQRVVGAQLVFDLRLAALFDVKHLVDLMPHRRIILEIEGGERADLDAARPRNCPSRRPTSRHGPSSAR